MTRSIAALLALISAVPTPAQVRPQTTPPPAATAPSAERRDRAARIARIDRALGAFVESGAVPGLVALVLQDGRPVYERAMGFADREAGRKMTTDALFRIASQTKALTSTAAMILMEEGKLLIADPVSKYIPAFAKTTVAVRADGGVQIVPAKRQITVRDLLTHTSGVSYGTNANIARQYEAQGLGPAAGLGWYFADKDEPICATMERLAALPFVAQPGESWVYGYSTDILGCVVERASGQTLDAFIRDRITGPLRMHDTFFFVPRDKAARLTAVYASAGGGPAERAPDGPRGQGDYVGGPHKSFSGGAGLVSTAHDYARFLEMIRRGGVLDGVRILSPATAKLMTVNATGTLHSQSGMGWSLAFETTETFGGNGLSAPGAFGWGGAYGSVYRVDPADRLTMILLIQLMPNTTNIRETFPNLVYQAFAGGR